MMYLCLWRAEKRAQSRVIMQLWPMRTIVGLGRPNCILESKTGRERNEEEAGMLNFELLERQLHVLFIIVIIEIVAPVMHGKEVHEADLVVQRFMFYKMLQQGRYLQHLVH